MITTLDFKIDPSYTTEVYMDGHIVSKSVTKLNYAVIKILTVYSNNCPYGIQSHILLCT